MRARVVVSGLSVLLLGCGQAQPPGTVTPAARDGVIDFTPVPDERRTVVELPAPPLGADALCEEASPDAVVTFEDEALETAVRRAVTVLPTTRLTCRLLSSTTTLNFRSLEIESLAGIQNLRRVTGLSLSDNGVTDLTPLARLTALRSLRLNANPGLSDIGPLLDHPSLEEVALVGTRVSCEDVARLEARGVFVFSGC